MRVLNKSTLYVTLKILRVDNERLPLCFVMYVKIIHIGCLSVGGFGGATINTVSGPSVRSLLCIEHTWFESALPPDMCSSGYFFKL